MYFQFCLPVWKYRIVSAVHILTSVKFTSFATRIHSNNIIFSNMSFSNSSLTQASPAKDASLPTIYILSRIKGLSSTLHSLSRATYPELILEEIPVSDDSDILCPSSVEKVNAANVIVVDPTLLAFNYKSMPKLKWAHSTWAGIEPLFRVITQKPKFILTRHAEDEFSEQMAEYVMAQILILQKNYKAVWAGCIEKSWSKMTQCVFNSKRNIRLKELTIGVLGVGNMGQAIAKFFKPHGARVIGLSRRVRKPHEYGFFHKIESSLTEVLAISNFIVNTLPSTPETVGLLNGDILKFCTKAPVFINVGRGNIISEDMLVKALENNWLSHAVLDVFQEEPLPTSSKLWNLTQQVTITPHCAAISEPKDVAKGFLACLECYQQNIAMENVVDWEKGY